MVMVIKQGYGIVSMSSPLAAMSVHTWVMVRVMVMVIK